ncbi:MAG: hypothetical protein SVX43_08160 [Cyanobacteriota bacterium]|nr:hypothetical protein [Cyanobacteriota bacterium]
MGIAEEKIIILLGAENLVAAIALGLTYYYSLLQPLLHLSQSVRVL